MFPPSSMVSSFSIYQLPKMAGSWETCGERGLFCGLGERRPTHESVSMVGGEGCSTAKLRLEGRSLSLVGGARVLRHTGVLRHRWIMATSRLARLVDGNGELVNAVTPVSVDVDLFRLASLLRRKSQPCAASALLRTFAVVFDLAGRAAHRRPRSRRAPARARVSNPGLSSARSSRKRPSSHSMTSSDSNSIRGSPALTSQYGTANEQNWQPSGNRR
jgi:hypothetical protein